MFYIIKFKQIRNIRNTAIQNNIENQGNGQSYDALLDATQKPDLEGYTPKQEGRMWYVEENGVRYTVQVAEGA